LWATQVTVTLGLEAFECSNTPGDDEVSSSSISYLPATFTTLFFLAASLLLGLMN